LKTPKLQKLQIRSAQTFEEMFAKEVSKNVQDIWYEIDDYLKGTYWKHDAQKDTGLYIQNKINMQRVEEMETEDMINTAKLIKDYGEQDEECRTVCVLNENQICTCIDLEGRQILCKPQKCRYENMQKLAQKAIKYVVT
jgi:hypothetical protein